MEMSIEECLKTLAADPSNREARRALSGVATRKVGAELVKLGLDERPNLSAIADEILDENGSRLTSEMKRQLVPIVRSVVDGVFDDDEPTGVTEVLRDWGETGKVDEAHLYESLQVALGKRLRWVLSKPQFGSLTHKVSPGDLMAELFIKLNQYGIPRLLENRKEFFWYSETVVKNLLTDMQRAARREKRPQTRNKQHLDDLLKILEDGGMSGGQVSLTPEAWLDVRDAINNLPAPLRDPMRRCYLWGWTPMEIREELEIPRSTLTRHLSQGLATLREVLIRGGYSVASEQT
jgi:RNA polymerase sigma factor (sigma-70 family)